MTTDAANNADQRVDAMSEILTAPLARECLPCYLLRMLDRFGCDNSLRWARRWRDRNASGLAMLLPWLESRGGYCDCEALWNVFEQELPDEEEPLPPCAGAPRGSTRPCRRVPTPDRDEWADEP